MYMYQCIWYPQYVCIHVWRHIQYIYIHMNAYAGVPCSFMFMDICKMQVQSSMNYLPTSLHLFLYYSTVQVKTNIWIKNIICSHQPISLNQQYSTLKIPYVSQMVFCIKSFLRRPHPSIHPSIDQSPPCSWDFRGEMPHITTRLFRGLMLFSPFEINDTWHFGWLRLIKPGEGEQFCSQKLGGKGWFLCVFRCLLIESGHLKHLKYTPYNKHSPWRMMVGKDLFVRAMYGYVIDRVDISSLLHHMSKTIGRIREVLGPNTSKQEIFL